MSYWNFFCVLFFSSYKYVCCNHFHLQARMFFFLIVFFFLNLMLHAHSYFMLLKAIASHVMCFFLSFLNFIVCLISLAFVRGPNCNLIFINFFYWFAEMRACPENASLHDLWYAILDEAWVKQKKYKYLQSIIKMRMNIKSIVQTFHVNDEWFIARITRRDIQDMFLKSLFQQLFLLIIFFFFYVLFMFLLHKMKNFKFRNCSRKEMFYRKRDGHGNWNAVWFCSDKFNSIKNTSIIVLYGLWALCCIVCFVFFSQDSLLYTM